MRCPLVLHGRRVSGRGPWCRVWPAGLPLNRQQGPRDGAPVLCVCFVEQGWKPALQPSARAGGTESSQVWPLGSPSKAVRSQLTVSFASSEPVACGQGIVAAGLTSRSVLRRLWSKQKFGNSHSPQPSVKSELVKLPLSAEWGPGCVPEGCVTHLCAQAQHRAAGAWDAAPAGAGPPFQGLSVPPSPGPRAVRSSSLTSRGWGGGALARLHEKPLFQFRTCC